MGLKPVFRVPARSSRPRSDAEQTLGQPEGPIGAGFPQPFNAASRTRRLIGWRPANQGPNSVTALSAPDLIRRSRDLARNNPTARKAMSLYPTHIVGTGIKPRPRCSNVKVRTALTQLFDDWTKVADADGQLDFYGMQALAVSEMVEAGEMFGRLRSRRLSDGLPVPLQIQMLPAEQLPLTWQTDNGGNLVRQGIERNPIGARVGYWFYPQNPTDLLTMGQPIDMQPQRVDAADVLHMFALNRIGQLRGLPWLGAVMTTLFQINNYMDAELLRKQLAAAFVAWIEMSTPEEPTAADVARVGTPSQAAPGPVPTVDMEPGTVQYLEPGQVVKFNSPADVGTSFEAFLAANYRAVTAGSDLLYEELTGDWKGTTDRIFRAEFNTFKRRARMWQYNTVCVQFNDPIWQRFIDYAVASGALKVPKSVTDIDLRRVDWVADRWQYLNPVQDIEATGLEIGLGLTARSNEVAARGDDVEVLDQTIANDKAREAALGLAFGSGIAKASATPDLAGVDQAGAVTPAAPGSDQGG